MDVEFWDQRSRREMKLVVGGEYAGWLCWRHPDGQWVTLRRATKDDRMRIELAAQTTGRCALVEAKPDAEATKEKP